MADIIRRVIQERRSLNKALAEIRLKCQQKPSPELERMIRELEAEIIRRGKTSCC
jgi:hypothetical protein